MLTQTDFFPVFFSIPEALGQRFGFKPDIETEFQLAAIFLQASPYFYIALNLIAENRGLTFIKKIERAAITSLKNVKKIVMLSGREQFVSHKDKCVAPQSSAQVPYAKDGTYLCPIFCRKSTGYTVSEKGNERAFHDYQEAMEYLKNMPSVKWRSPDPKGNWGIVTATIWKSVA